MASFQNIYSLGKILSIIKQYPNKDELFDDIVEILKNFVLIVDTLDGPIARKKKRIAANNQATKKKKKAGSSNPYTFSGRGNRC
jgi:hypothetical protein